ncbi:hypothetical protein MUY27_14710 [Mucilaginibacter sp. RS28]|uniref:Uncharacterized protein n=1 Tax=Mucilaginibacter straminoryzae TaxID=2932774 RepID=A0A9X1X4B9_9SPHI|nr:hypothetical protein [Mucilaginibacter straminoryzae]MCJ8210967.1 hypothetical protein [Mucilaginibacter straminoryzae]
MKNRIIGYLLLLGLLCTQFSQYITVAGFNYNQKYIAAKFCINKNRPWLHCNGKCYLMKKLKQAAEKEKAAERENLKNNLQTPYFAATAELTFVVQPTRTLFVPERPIHLPDAHLTIFQPPQA